MAVAVSSIDARRFRQTSRQPKRCWISLVAKREDIFAHGAGSAIKISILKRAEAVVSLRPSRDCFGKRSRENGFIGTTVFVFKYEKVFYVNVSVLVRVHRIGFYLINLKPPIGRIIH